jgi:hypothetical protein
MDTQHRIGDDVTITTMSNGLIHGVIIRTETLYGRTTLTASSHASGAAITTTPACILTNHTRTQTDPRTIRRAS